MEPAATNLVIYSGAFDNTAWEAAGAGPTRTIIANAAVSPDGTSSADRITAVNTSNSYAAISFINSRRLHFQLLCKSRNGECILVIYSIRLNRRSSVFRFIRPIDPSCCWINKRTVKSLLLKKLGMVGIGFQRFGLL